MLVGEGANGGGVPCVRMVNKDKKKKDAVGSKP